MYFKVTDSQMRSLYYSEYHGHGIQYEFDKMVKPTRGRIFVYSLEHLINTGFPEFDHLDHGDKRLFICQCLFPKNVTVYVRKPYCLSEHQVGRFCDIKKGYLASRYATIRDVVLTAGVKLIREVSSDELQKFIENRDQLLQAWRTRNDKCISK